MMIELTDLHYTFEPVTVPANRISATLNRWVTPWGSSAVQKAEEFQAAVLAEDYDAMAEIAGELGIGFDFPR